jgi:hypothetical protein
MRRLGEAKACNVSAILTADTGSRVAGPAVADRRRHDLLQEGAEDHIRTGQLGEPQHVIGAQRRFESQILGADDFVAVVTQAAPQGLGHPTEAGVNERYPERHHAPPANATVDVVLTAHATPSATANALIRPMYFAFPMAIPRLAVGDTAFSATFATPAWFAPSRRA